MECIKCKSGNVVKAGYIAKKQRYKCNNCGYHFTINQKGKSLELKRLALELYLEGNSFRAIGRLLKVSNVSVLKWIRNFGETVERYRKTETQTEIIEMDEVHTYIKSKKSTAGYGWLLIGIGKDGSISCWARGEQEQGESYGIVSRQTKIQE